ncbi:YesL family protein [Brachybacterium phenoliresistens]|nr:DUF624 domain-containing protein [Brachybacterium phenoliresistens]
MGLGELGLRLFLLHLLWIAGTLAGLVVAGLFPATAAVHAVLREDQREAARERAGEDTPPRPGLWRAFWSAWRAELGRANRIGAVLVLGWAVIALDRWILTGAIGGGSSTAAHGGGALDLGAAAPWISGVVVALTIVTALLSIVVWPLAAHFDDPLPRIWRMTLSLLVTRLPLTLSIAAVLMASVWVWQSIPGLVPVFGLALPFWAVSMLIWRSGVLPRT